MGHRPPPADLRERPDGSGRPAPRLSLDRAPSGAFPEGYRHLAYLQSSIGFEVKDNLPGLRGDAVEKLYGEGARVAGGLGHARRRRSRPHVHQASGPFSVSALGLGCMSLSHAYGTPPPPEDGVKVLLKALDLGYTHLDSAALYGFGANETLVGRCSNIAFTSWCWPPRAGCSAMRRASERSTAGPRSSISTATRACAAAERDDRPLLPAPPGQAGCRSRTASARSPTS